MQQNDNFFFEKLFLTSAHQNNKKNIKKIKTKKIKIL
jgi:hypothetical protein